MTAWHFAMLGIIPLMGSRQRMRCWVTMLAASAAAWLIGAAAPIPYMFIDLVGGLVILTRPYGIGQRAIGMVFAMMAIFDAGYLLSPQVDNGQLYTEALTFLGWVQFSILTIWGLHDVGKALFSPVRSHWRQVAHR